MFTIAAPTSCNLWLHLQYSNTSQALIPYVSFSHSVLKIWANEIKLELYYHENYTIISLVFLAPFLGYTLAAFLNNKIHMHFGQLGVAVIAPICHVVAYVATCVHPPYPALPIIFMLAGFGSGLEVRPPCIPFKVYAREETAEWSLTIRV